MTERGHHIGQIGQTIASVAVEVLSVRVFSGQRYRRDPQNARRSNPVKVEVFYSTMKGPQGETYQAKSETFAPENGDKLLISGKVKDHKAHNGWKQTELTDVKILADLKRTESLNTDTEKLEAIRKLVKGTPTESIKSYMTNEYGYFIPSTVWALITNITQEKSNASH